jgi:O-antigen/teichoic acid export membrane protein
MTESSFAPPLDCTEVQEPDAAAVARTARSLPHRIVAQCLHPGVVSVIDQGVVSGTSFVTAIIIGRTCSHEDLGIYYLALTVAMLCTAVSCDLVSVPYTMHCNRHHGAAAASHAGSTLVHQLVLSLIVVACLLAFAALLSLGVEPQSLRPVSWVLVGVVPLLLLREFVRRYAFAHLALFTTLAVDVAVTVLQLGGLLLVCYFHRISVPAVYVIMGVACGLACAAWFAAARRGLHVVATRIIPDWRDHWSFGKWALAGELAGLSFYALPWMLTVAHGEAATGVFCAGNTLVGLANLFVNGMRNYLTPKTSHAYAEGGAGALSRVVRWAGLLFIAVLGAFCVAIWFAGDALTALLFGSRYAGNGLLLELLALATCADALGMTAGNGLWALDRPAANLAVEIVQLIVTLVVAVALVMPLGVLGIALALVAGRALGATLRWCVLYAFLSNQRGSNVPVYNLRR